MRQHLMMQSTACVCRPSTSKGALLLLLVLLLVLALLLLQQLLVLLLALLLIMLATAVIPLATALDSGSNIFSRHGRRAAHPVTLNSTLGFSCEVNSSVLV
jgi:hypothetical protein